MAEKNAHEVRIQFVKRPFPKNGSTSSEDWNSSIDEIAVDLTALGDAWNRELYPLLSTLPQGTLDDRWDLPATLDPLTNGLDGAHFLMDINASATADSGRFWYSSGSRPKTLKEVASDIYDDIATMQSEVDSLSSSTSSGGGGLSNDQWARLGTWVQDGTSSGPPGSMHTQLLQAETDISTNTSNLSAHIAKQGHGTSDSENPHAIAMQDVDDLQTEFGYTNDFVGKSALGLGSPSYSSNHYVANGDSLQKAIGELDTSIYTYTQNNKTELSYVRTFIGKDAEGSEAPSYSSHWFITVDGSLETAIGQLDTALYTQLLSAGDELFNMRAYMGKTAEGSEMPTYSSENYVTSGDSLETAIGDLDTALHTHEIDAANPHSVTALQAGAAVRKVKDFSGHTSASDPIVFTHGMGTAGYPNAAYPLVQVVDTGAGPYDGVLIDEVYTYEQELGIATTDAFVNVEYIDSDTLYVYTNITAGKIICVF